MDIKGIQNWFVVLLWLIMAMGCIPYLHNAKQPFKIGGITAPQSESAKAQYLMESRLPYGGSRIFILYTSDTLQVENATFKKEVKESLAGLSAFSLKHHINSPYDNDNQISPDKHAAYAVIVMNDKTADESSNHMTELRSLLGQPEHLTMLVGGQPSYIADVNKLSQENLIRGELIALPLSIIALIFIFRGIIAALLPLLSGIISITIIITLLYIIGRETDLTVFVLNIATMLGLGLTLDYTLMITYRYREELAHGKSVKEAIKITMATAGKAVFFSGLTVLISISSLLFFPINVLHSIGVGGVVVVLISVLSALTFLPALLCVLGRRVNAGSFMTKGFYAEHARKSWWYRCARLVMKFPFTFMIPTILFLLFLGSPILHVKLSRSDPTILPTWVESRMLLDQFSLNFNSNQLTPIEILFTAKDESILNKNNIGALYDYAQKLKKDKRVDKIYSIVTGKDLNKKQYQTIYQSPDKLLSGSAEQLFKETTKGKYTVMNVISTSAVNSEDTLNLVRAIRDSKVGNHLTKQVTGTSAVIIDAIKASYTLFFKAIIFISIITYFTLLILLRSVILPLKAILMNFLSLSVCYGMLVFIFQEGHFAHFLDFAPQGYTDMNVPILLFFILFGLSMDYEVFLLSRIKEFYEKTGDNNLSVALGIERSARIITSAALLVIIVAGAFVTADIVFMKAFSLGTALAIAVDATIIRIILVPATMRMLGKWNWYLPKWLDKLLPDIRFDQDM